MINTTIQPRIKKYFLIAKPLMKAGSSIGALVEFTSADQGDYYTTVYRAFDQQNNLVPADTYSKMQDMDPMFTVEGIFYEESLSYDGAWFSLLALPDTPKEQIERAKNTLRRTRDVVNISVVQVDKIVPFEMPARD